MEIGGVRLINIGIEIEKDFPIDTIHVAINLEGRKDTKEECTSEYNRLLEAIKDSLEDAGIPRDEIKNGSYRVSTHTERLYVKDEDGDYYVAASELRGYEYSASMTLERPTLTTRRNASGLHSWNAGAKSSSTSASILPTKMRRGPRCWPKRWQRDAKGPMFSRPQRVPASPGYTP